MGEPFEIIHLKAMVRGGHKKTAGRFPAAAVY
jgi:hypothetical protein